MSKPIKFMFFDYWDYEYVRGFQRRLGQPRKSADNPILVATLPWEHNCMHLYGTVLKDPIDGLFKMWYSVWGEHRDFYILYATAQDGHHWTRPELDVVPGTNIVMPAELHPIGPTVIVDVAEPDPSRRYKAMMRPVGTVVINAYISRDGIHWKLAQEEPVIVAPSDAHIGLYRDPQTGIYHCSFRLFGCDRRVWRSESEDFVHWRRPVLGIEPVVEDRGRIHIYNMQMTPYGNYVMGWLSVLYTEEWDLHYGKCQGTMDVQLAHSRDGYCWHRTAIGEKFIPLGAPGAWDSGLVSPSSGPVLLSDEMLFYYSGRPYGHGELHPEIPEGLGVASLRPDGFLALHAGEGPGQLMTRPFAVREPGLYVNADATQGQVRVALCEGSSAKPFQGFTFEDCRPLCGSGSTQQVTWAGNPDPTIMVNRPIRVALRAQRADVYSVTLTNGNDPARYWEFRELVANDPMDNLVRDF